MRLIDAHGLPRPRFNADVAVAGRFFCADCLWPQERLIVELDGRAAHGTRNAFEDDRERDRLLHRRWLASDAGDLAPAPRRRRRGSPRIYGRLYAVGMSRELFEHYLRDETRLGPPLDGGFTGAAGGAACGDLSRISLLIEDGRDRRGDLRRRGVWGHAGGYCGGRRDGRRGARDRGGADRDRRGRRGGRRADSRQASRRAARRRRAAPGAGERRRVVGDACRARARAASWSRCRAASTAPSPRCSNASGGPRCSPSR